MLGIAQRRSFSTPQFGIGGSAHAREPLKIPYRGGTVFATPELTAGPTLARALRQLQDFKPGRAPDAAAYTAYVETIQAAYRERLKGMKLQIFSACDTID